jgi:hypothetical protein
MDEDRHQVPKGSEIGVHAFRVGACTTFNMRGIRDKSASEGDGRPWMVFTEAETRSIGNAEQSTTFAEPASASGNMQSFRQYSVQKDRRDESLKFEELV